MEQLHSTFAMNSVPLLEVSLAPIEQHLYACLAFLKLQEDAGKLKAALVDLREMGPEGYTQQVLAAEALWHRRWISLNSSTKEHQQSAATGHTDENPNVPIAQKSNGRVKGNGNAMETRETAPIAAATQWDPSILGKGRKHVAQAVKDLQRTDPAGNAEWWTYCATHACGLRDPCRHTLSFLQKFLADFHTGHRNKGPGKSIGLQGTCPEKMLGLDANVPATSGTASAMAATPLGPHIVGKGSTGKGGSVNLEGWSKQSTLQEQLPQNQISHDEFLSDLRQAILQEAPHSGQSLIGLDQFAPPMPIPQVLIQQPLHPGHVRTSPELPMYRDDPWGRTDDHPWYSEPPPSRSSGLQAPPGLVNRVQAPPGLSVRSTRNSPPHWGMESQVPACHQDEQSIRPEPQSKQKVTTVLHALNSMLDQMVAAPVHGRDGNHHVPPAELNPDHLQELQNLMGKLSFARMPQSRHSTDESHRATGRSVWTTGTLPSLLEAGTSSLPQATPQDSVQPVRLPQPVGSQQPESTGSQQKSFRKSPLEHSYWSSASIHDSLYAMEREGGPHHHPQQDQEPSAWLLPQPRFST
jgi:hypothetical protein